MAATEEKDVEKTIAEDLVVTKYKLAGEIVNSKYYGENWIISFAMQCNRVEPIISRTHHIEISDHLSISFETNLMAQNNSRLRNQIT